MSINCILITIVGLCVLQCQGQQMTFNMQPQKMTLFSNETFAGKPMTLICNAPNSWYLTSVEFSRIRETSHVKEVIAGGFFNMNGGYVSARIPGITAEGSLTAKSGTVVFSAAKCSDRGIYTCKITYITQTSRQAESSTNFTVEVLPEKIQLTADPNYSSYRVGDTLILACNGVVGTTDDGTEVTWVWQYQDPTDFGSLWNEVDSNMVEAGASSNFPCYENQISYLRLTKLSLEDSGRTYRCFVQRKGQNYEQFGDSFKIQSVTAPVPQPKPTITTTTPTSSSSCECNGTSTTIRGQEVNANGQRALEALVTKVNWAVRELGSTEDVDRLTLLCTLIKEASQAMTSVQNAFVYKTCM